MCQYKRCANFGYAFIFKFILSFRWEEYLQGCQPTHSADSQQTLGSFFPTSEASTSDSSAVKYRSTNFRQKQITDAVTQLVVRSSLPLSFVEDKNFRDFLQVLDPRWEEHIFLIYSLAEIVCWELGKNHFASVCFWCFCTFSITDNCCWWIKNIDINEYAY